MTSTTLAAPMAHIREFHEVFARTPHPTGPTLLTPFQVERRVTWCAEEGQEIREATTIAEQADGFLDMIYFALGGLDEMGIDPSPIWDIIHGANMAKRQPDGSVKRHPETGKTLKPGDWQDPDPLIRAEVERQIASALPQESEA
ncbi:hypothetical protein [Brevundimonas sp. LjRoot202]|uniref:hypothetical protein n=1 Tax=Brevundimonas sp. LjRoot202 TaxID=3342281 RepID=UPI003ECFD874